MSDDPLLDSDEVPPRPVTDEDFAALPILDLSAAPSERDEPLFDSVTLGRCPFVRLVADGNLDGARRLAAAPPEPAEPVVIDWLVAEARRHLDATRG